LKNTAAKLSRTAPEFPTQPKRHYRMFGMDAIRQFAKQIVREFQPERVILFGSRAKTRQMSDSDADVLVILPFEGKSFYKSLEILNKTDPPFPVDLLARRPDDTARRYAEGDPLIREALDSGLVLYERHG